MDNKHFFSAFFFSLVICMFFTVSSCTDEEAAIVLNEAVECTQAAQVNLSRGACDQTLTFTPQVTITETNGQRIFNSNSIPDHKVGLFGNSAGALNPSAISEQNISVSITMFPQKADELVPLLNEQTGPEYAFGILLNGVELDPEAAEPWPHTRPIQFNSANWAWNLDAASVNLGLDCNNAHVQPTGKYHYHASPTLYLESLNISSNEMTLVGYAADGFPIYSKYGYIDANDSSSGVKSLQSSYQLKSGERPGDGDTAPCGAYTGIYTNDYEYIEGLGDLDECNGRSGITPEYPNGTYYYIISDTYPYIGRCLLGIPSNSFRLG